MTIGMNPKQSGIAPESLENILGKCWLQCPFPQCFQKGLFQRFVKLGIVRYRVNIYKRIHTVEVVLIQEVLGHLLLCDIECENEHTAVEKLKENVLKIVLQISGDNR